MSFTPRTYEEVVRDLLTTLTGGTVRESVDVPPAGPVPLNLLADRPVRRVSHLEGRIDGGPGRDPLDYRFTSADFELVAASASPSGVDLLRFREGGRRPLPGSKLVVNYYPVQTEPVPLTDLNVGSVVRTMMETFARELSLTWLHMDHVYKSAFLDTAEGSSLDKVVALVGVTRLPAGYPVVKVRFDRTPGSPGRITVPVGTPVTDGADARYLTLETLTLEPGESAREVLTAGATPGTPLVDPAALDRLEVFVAGVSAVTNPKPARGITAPESDGALRRRARGAVHGAVRGTLDALRFGLLSIQEVKSVEITEFPNGVPGEIAVDVAVDGDEEAIWPQVLERIEQLRPAGVRVIPGVAARTRPGVRVELTLAGSGLPTAEITPLQEAVEERLAGYLADVGPGGNIRRSRLTVLALEDPRVADARVVLLEEGAPEAEELQLAPGMVADVQRPFGFPPPATESGPTAATAFRSLVTVAAPVHLQPGVPAAEAEAAVRLAVEGHLTTRGAAAALTVDGLVADARDDSRYALVRDEVLVTVEAGDRFLQLSDGLGEYAPAATEVLDLDRLDLEVREGS